MQQSPSPLRGGSVTASPAPARGPGLRLGLALTVISLAQLMLVLDELIVNTALPQLSGLGSLQLLNLVV